MNNKEINMYSNFNHPYYGNLKQPNMTIIIKNSIKFNCHQEILKNFIEFENNNELIIKIKNYNELVVLTLLEFIYQGEYPDILEETKDYEFLQELKELCLEWKMIDIAEYIEFQSKILQSSIIN